jgi:hypothetical protein
MRKTKLVIICMVVALVALFTASEVMAGLTQCAEVQAGSKGYWYRICTLKAGVPHLNYLWWGPDGELGTEDDSYVTAYEYQFKVCQLTGKGGTCTSGVPNEVDMPFADCSPTPQIITYWYDHNDFHLAEYQTFQSWNADSTWYQFSFAAGDQIRTVYTNSPFPQNNTLAIKVNNTFYPVGPVEWIGCPGVVPPVALGSETFTDPSGNTITCYYRTSGGLREALYCEDQDGNLVSHYSLKDYDLMCYVVDRNLPGGAPQPTGATIAGPMTLRDVSGSCGFEADTPDIPGCTGTIVNGKIFGCLR